MKQFRQKNIYYKRHTFQYNMHTFIFRASPQKSRK